MKLYHFALLFLLISGGLFVTIRIQSVTKMQNECMRKTEYGCLVAAVNAVTDVVFDGVENKVTRSDLEQGETVFFQTLGVLHDGTTDHASWDAWKQRIPCLVVFDADGYYVYCYVPQKGYMWLDLRFYEGGQIPEYFFRETEELLSEYQSTYFQTSKKYRMEPAGNSVWEQSMEPPCVFAIYAPASVNEIGKEPAFLYAATGLGSIAYYVTEDNYCHYSFCEEVGEQKVTAYYGTQKESAKDGAVPCEKCMK